MSREKQSGDCKNCNSHVEEMAKDAGCPSRLPCKECLLYNECDRLVFAESLYNAGYRKQEWISVIDELPEMYTDVLYFDGQSIGVDFICSDVAWCDEEVRSNKVTHWMPLPEAPKMKGGAEE